MIDPDIIGPGHWIFAGISITAFLVFLVWSYRKDLPVHKRSYKGSSIFLLVLLMIFFLLFIFKRLF
jgi:cytochrome bd-type quinol oxidase subunit 1